MGFYELVDGLLAVVDFLLLRLPGFHGVCGGEGVFGQFGACEDAEQRIVVLGWDGIEFMIVALGAGDGEAEESTSGGIDAIVLELGAEGIEAEAGFGFGAGRRREAGPRRSGL